MILFHPELLLFSADGRSCRLAGDRQEDPEVVQPFEGTELPQEVEALRQATQRHQESQAKKNAGTKPFLVTVSKKVSLL